MYSASDTIECCDIYGVGDRGKGEETAEPFVHLVQLIGKGGELIDIEATFDDGALVNAIDTATFDSARPQLSEPSPSPKVLRMANGVLVPSGGSWRGKITAGGVSAVGKFEIFLGGGVWQMLLGKPMLQAFGASHEYVNDTVTLRTAPGAVTLQNEVKSEGSHRNKVAVAHVSDPGECASTSPLRQGQVVDISEDVTVDHALESQTSVPATYTDSEDIKISQTEGIEDGSRTPKVAVAHASGPGACIPCLPPLFGARHAAKMKHAKERARAREALMLIWAEMEKNLVRRIKSRSEKTRRILLRWWYNTPYVVDTTVPPSVVGSGSQSEDDIVFGPPISTADGKVLCHEVEDAGDGKFPETKGLRNKSRYASASNPGECFGTSPLRSKEVPSSRSPVSTHTSVEWGNIAELEVNDVASAGAEGLRKIKVAVASASNLGECNSNSPLRPSTRATVEDCEDDDDADAEGLRKNKVAYAHASNPGGSVDSLPLKQRKVPNPDQICSADKHAEILAVFEEAQLDNSAPGTEQPEIDVDDRDASIYTCHSDPFNPARVSKIMELVKIGDDISAEEHTLVEATIREYADVYALSISEVKQIPGAVHRLNVPEDAKLNTKIQQRRLTPPQTAYFSKALDAMIEAGVVAPIAAADVKCVSPITLAAKAHQSGGLTIEELHSKINEECARAHEPTFCARSIFQKS
ncbi:hypothetical protein B0H11DRAFT_2247135 [Mycena galericulata]|nr:hypothetical protein B0H11DRAFT_2247135 [Mycena galericulata]